MWILISQLCVPLCCLHPKACSLLVMARWYVPGLNPVPLASPAEAMGPAVQQKSRIPSDCISLAQTSVVKPLLALIDQHWVTRLPLNAEVKQFHINPQDQGFLTRDH